MKYFSNLISKSRVAIAAFAIVCGLTHIAPGIHAELPSDLPEVTNYYPGINTENPMELKSGSKAYIYFARGSQVAYTKAQIIQNDKVLGSVTYTAKSPTTTLTMEPTAAENTDALNAITNGYMTFNFYEISYFVDGEERLYSDTENPFGNVTYQRKVIGTVVSETGLDDNLILSYYPTSSTEGTKTFTFSCPISPNNINAFFEYGNTESNPLTSVPWHVSDDGYSLTIDLRGHCYNVATLAPGVTFVDDSGNPTTPPQSISLTIKGVVGANGESIKYIIPGPTPNVYTEKYNEIFKSFSYRDITLPNPELTGAEFYAAADPETHFNMVKPSTDMVDLFVSNDTYIASADIAFKFGQNTITVPSTDVTRTDGIMSAKLPSQLIASGQQPIISLVNVIFTTDDGAEHIIRPLNIGNAATDITTIAEMKTLEPNTEVSLLTDNLLVTMSNAEFGYTFAEDASGAVQVTTPNYTTPLSEGALLKGKIAGTYIGNNVFMINIDESDFTTLGKNIEVGTIATSLTEALADENTFRLLTFEASNDLTIENQSGNIVIGDLLPVVTDFIGNAKLPENIKNVTGILYNDASQQAALLVRSAADFNQDIHSMITTPEVDYNTDAAVYNLMGVKIPTQNLLPGIYIRSGRKFIVK